MGTAIVPAFPTDADIINDVALRLSVRLMHFGRGVVKALRSWNEQATARFLEVGEAVKRFYVAGQGAGIFPPDPWTQKHGTIWVSPLDGERFRVRGRRGRPHTFHWGRP